MAVHPVQIPLATSRNESELRDRLFDPSLLSEESRSILEENDCISLDSETVLDEMPNVLRTRSQNATSARVARSSWGAGIGIA